LRDARKVNYWRYLKIAFPVVLILSIYGYFRDGNKPDAEPSSLKSEATIAEKKFEPAASKPTTAESVQPVAPGSKGCDVCPEKRKCRGIQ
jgi:hypothetical protein